MHTGLADEICPPSTQFAAYNRIEAQKHVVVYPDYGHEGIPGLDDRILAFMVDALGPMPTRPWVESSSSAR